MPVIPGQTVTGNLADYTNSSDQNCGDSGAAGGGADATYVLQNVQQGDRVRVTSTYAYDGFILVGSGCNFGTENVDSCIQQADSSESGDAASPDGDLIEFLAPTTGDYYITVDTGDFSTPMGDPNGPDFTLTFDVQTPVCSPGTPSVCNAAADGIEFCGSLGFPQTYTCSSSMCDRATGRCAMPSADNCPEAIPLSSGQPVTGEVAGLTDTFSEDCGISTAATGGPDAVYVMENLKVGDVIDISADFEYDGLVYITQSCSVSNGIGGVYPGRR